MKQPDTPPTLEQIAIEEWRPCADFPGYSVSSLGRVRGLKGQLMKQRPNPGGYPTVAVKGPVFSSATVHKLVLTAFVGPKPPGLTGAHLDGNKLNNVPANLKWVTSAENARHKIAHGTHPGGSKNPQARLTDDDVMYIRTHFVGKAIGQRPNRIELAKKFSMHPQAVYALARGIGWQHLPLKKAQNYEARKDRIAR